MPRPVAVLVFLVLAATLTLAEIKIGHRKFEQNCTVNRDCEKPLKCIPVTFDKGPCGTRTPNGNHRCQCRMPSGLGQMCNDLQDCINLRCVNNSCLHRGRENRACGPYLDDRDCEDGFTCLKSKCTAKVDEDEYCEVFWNCKGKLACIKNRCRPKSRPGGPCDSSIDCENSICVMNDKGERRCSSDIQAILGSVVAFTVVVATTGTLQFCAWRPRRRG